jgi:hypothetical protein
MPVINVNSISGINSVTAQSSNITFYNNSGGLANVIGNFTQSQNVAIIADEKADGTAGGTFTSGAWQTRVLNTIVADPISIVSSLSSNQFTLAAGTYLIKAICPAFACEEHQARIYDVTNATVIDYGTVMFCHVNNFGFNLASVSGLVTISASTTYRIEHRCNVTRSTDGFGRATPWTENVEVYSTVEIYKL